VAFARQHNQVVRGHTLVWHNQVPRWLTEASFTPAELADILRQHIAEEASHFRGAVDAWDVVNEPFNEDGTWRDTIWFRALGPDYVRMAFEWAQAADPEARLYLNDYNVESIGPKSNAMYTLVQDLLASGVPVQGVGFQAHLSMDKDFPSTLRENLERFAALGLELAITEADVRMRLPATPDKLAVQAEYFARLAQACLDVPPCVSFTVWGFADAHSWVSRRFEGYGAATLFDDRVQPKPAYAAVSDVLRATVSP
jgi:endo-1,4-beta-xylanase